MIDSMDRRIIFGDPDQQQEFQNRNTLFFACFTDLKDLIDVAFGRDVELKNPADRATYFLGRLCFEDFMEIICLSANGYGIGAMKLVRGLYERAVTLSYLASCPEEASAFWDWRFVSRYKTVHAYVNGGTPAPGWIAKEKELRQRYYLLKESYEVDDCKKCGTKRINHTWSKLDFASMAKKTGNLGMLLGQAYHAALNHAHCTSEGLMARLEPTENGEIVFKYGAQTLDADVALQLAHSIILSVIEVQQKQFGARELRDKLEKCENDHIRVWSGRGLGQDPANL